MFHSGFNVVLADRNRDNKVDEKRTRNGAGKTTLIEIIHFCLGSQVSKNSVFKDEHLKGWSFILEIDIGTKIYCIERFTDRSGKIYIEKSRLFVLSVSMIKLHIVTMFLQMLLIKQC